MLFPAIVLLGIASCDNSLDDNLSGEVTLVLKPEIKCDPDVSRAQPTVFNDEKFTNSTNTNLLDFGMWIGIPEDPFEPYSLGMANMKAEYNRLSETDQWTYYYGITAHKVLSIKPGDKVTIHAYYPYTPSVTDGSRVAVTSAVSDVLYADPVEVTAGTAGTSMDVSLKFNHAMTCIELIVEAIHDISGTLFKSVQITDARHSGSLLVSDAQLEVKDGTFSNKNYVDELTIESQNKTVYKQGSNSTPASVKVPLIPIEEYNDGDLSLTFTFAWDKTVKTCTFPLPKIGEDGFKQGYKYTYKLLFANESTFKIVGLGEWTAEPETTFDI